MIYSLLISAIFASVVVLGTYFLFSIDPIEFVWFYGENLRGSLFVGFLTIGGFLFSLKTFIIIKMKENVYDHKYYRERVENQRNLNKEISYYGPLKRLSKMLFASVLVSIITAVLQFTIGLIPDPLAVIICVWASCFSVALLVSSLLAIKNNLDNWFVFLEESSNKD